MWWAGGAGGSPSSHSKGVVSYDYGQASRAAKQEQKREQKERETEFLNLRSQDHSGQEDPEHVAMDDQDTKLLHELETDPGFTSG